MTLKSVTRLKSIEKNLTTEKLIEVGYPVFLRNTPIRSGNARRNTIKKSDEIEALYPYAKRLDQGWSRQSRQGMVKPTLLAIRNYIKSIIG